MPLESLHDWKIEDHDAHECSQIVAHSCRSLHDAELAIPAQWELYRSRFGITAPPKGTYKLLISLKAGHGSSPPKYRVTLNCWEKEFALAPGPGDDEIVLKTISGS